MNSYIGIEGGGTKFVCVYGSNPHDLHNRTIIKTTSPEETLNEVVRYIRTVEMHTDIKAIGIAIFGPLDLDPASGTYGHITAAAKPGWKDCNVLGYLKRFFDVPIGFDTDVNGAALGEYRFGAARGIDHFVYLTVGTGIGGGIIMNGKLQHGAMHPEMGHILIPQDTRYDTFPGVCRYHKNCLEGLASGTAMSTRWQVNSALDLPPHHPAWDLEAHYLGVGIANYILTFSPKRIIMGGGLMQQTHLLPKIRKEVLKCLNGYLQCEKIIDHLEDYLVLPGLNENSGICGAIALAEQSYYSLEHNIDKNFIANASKMKEKSEVSI